MDKKTWIIGILLGAILEFLILSIIGAVMIYNAKQSVANHYEAIISEAKVKAEQTTLNIIKEHRSIEKENKARLAAISADRDSLLNWVSNRPSRNDTNPGDRKTCTGSELSREYAEFLIREASRADEVIAERDKYYEEYESARRALAGSKAQNERLNGEKTH